MRKLMKLRPVGLADMGHGQPFDTINGIFHFCAAYKREIPSGSPDIGSLLALGTLSYLKRNFLSFLE